MAITTFEDVKGASKRDIPDSDQSWIEGKIREAELLIESYVGDLTAWIAVDPDKRTERVIAVVCRMVDRVVKNPDGFSTETDGDYAYGRDGSTSSGEVYVSRRDLRLLGVGTRRRYSSIRLHLPAESPRNISRGC